MKPLDHREVDSVGGPGDIREKLGDLAASAGLRRVHIVAWRDLDDPEAGGSELHASLIAERWADAGIDVTVRTSEVVGQPAEVERDGYRVVRKTGRYLVFPRSAVSGLLGRDGPRDGLVEIWNGMPFFSPLWARVPRVVFLHHVHAEMWRMALPPGLAAAGHWIERRLAPPLYRNSRIVTLSASSRQEIIEQLRLPAGNISVVPPGVDPRFTPGPGRSPYPLVAAVGRLVPVKRFDELIDVLVALKRRHPTLEAVIAGEGYERADLEARRHAAGADDWLHLPGRLSDDDLVGLYRRAWVLTASSLREGWGMTITEAAACGTPSVATNIGGHADAIVHGVTGFLVDEPRDLTARLDALLSDDARRRQMGEAAASRAADFTWDATARGTLEALADEAIRRRHP